MQESPSIDGSNMELARMGSSDRGADDKSSEGYQRQSGGGGVLGGPGGVGSGAGGPAGGVGMYGGTGGGGGGYGGASIFG